MPFLLLDLSHWSKLFIEGHLMGVSLCSVLGGCLKKKASCFVPLRFWSTSCRIQQGWKCFVNGSLIWLALGSSSNICLWNTVLTVFVWLCGKIKPFYCCWDFFENFVLMLAICRIQHNLTDKSYSSFLILTFPELPYLNASQSISFFVEFFCLYEMRCQISSLLAKRQRRSRVCNIEIENSSGYIKMLFYKSALLCLLRFLSLCICIGAIPTPVMA